MSRIGIACDSAGQETRAVGPSERRPCAVQRDLKGLERRPIPAIVARRRRARRDSGAAETARQAFSEAREPPPSSIFTIFPKLS